MASSSIVVEQAGEARQERFGRAERDIVALGIAVAALVLFVGTGGSVMSRIAGSWVGIGAGPDPVLANALLLNIALLIFGWRRYADLTKEVQERRVAEERARKLAETDALTGLLNRRSISKTAIETIGRCLKSNNDVAFLLLGLDGFKHVNEIYGHAAGDSVLVEAAKRIEALIPPDCALGRMASDEFVVILGFEMRNQPKIDRLASSLIDGMAKPFNTENGTVKVTLSIGIARTHDMTELEDPELCNKTLLRHADIALTHAKKQGRNRYAWFESALESELRFRNELETGIRNGIANGEFVPYYEQQVDLDTGEIVGFEMLARWNSPNLGFVSPEIFVPIAEEIDLIGDLSEQLIRKAFKDALDWDPRLSLSVNISPVQLRDPWFAQKILRLLVETGFPPARLDIEITESCLHENLGAVRSVMSSLKNQGIKITLDDFGTGYSSLAQLRSLPFDRLKIDRSFVTELAKDGANSKIVEAIVQLARGLELPITAEGVENDSVRKALRRMGDLKVQGYLFGRPEDAARTFDRLSRLNLLAALHEAEAEKDLAELAKEQDELPISSAFYKRQAI